MLNNKELSKKKIIEELSELIEAVEKNTNKIHETADVIYHLIVFLEVNNINIEEVMSELEKRKIKVDYNDKTRMDKWLDASSLSISKKNSFLFSKFLERTSTNENDWIEILISPNILTDKFGECIYCYTNASNHKFEEFRKNQSYLTNSTAFENMFADFVPRTSTNTGNKRLNHKDNETTDIQAEICVYGIIEKKYFFNLEELRQKII